MTQNYHRRQGLKSERRKSTTLPVFLNDLDEEGEGEGEDADGLRVPRRLSVCVNITRRLSTVSQLYLPHGNEYHPQDHIPPSGVDSQPSFLLSTLDEGERDEGKSLPHRLSIVSHLYQPIDESAVAQGKEVKRSSRRLLFVLEPLLSGVLLFPLLVLFWECGWNLVLILLNRLNALPSNLHLEEFDQEDFESYSSLSLLIPYLLVQLLLLLYYLAQNVFHRFLLGQRWLLRSVLLKVHIFILASIYIVQWEMLWTIWDQFSPHEWYFEFTLSVASLFALIVVIGHLSDLICSPFIYSYDSIDYCLFFGCPLLTREVRFLLCFHFLHLVPP